ncbi:ion transporter, partial [Rhizobium johnstonii]
RGLPPFLQTLSNVIWGLFILDFALSFALAPDKWTYLRRNALTAFSLLLPALRVLRAFRGLRALRALRLTRGANLLRVLT